MNHIAIVTAYNRSTRLPNKNILPLGYIPLAMHSVCHGIQSGLRTVLATDYPALEAMAVGYGAEYLTHLGGGCSHVEAIQDAAVRSGAGDCHIVLLQPTSPFRHGGVLERCLQSSRDNPNAVILTTQDTHCWVVGGNDVGHHLLWDGCIAIYPPGKVGNYARVVTVANHYINGLQIDTEADYIHACDIASRFHSLPNPLGQQCSANVQRALSAAGISNEPITLVGRGDGTPIDQTNRVAYINHCNGWDGGRADLLFIIANTHHTQVGISQATREVAVKASLVVVRDHGSYDWLYQNLPEMHGKVVRLQSVSEQLSNFLQTGTIAYHILTTAGCHVTFKGLQSSLYHMAMDSLGNFNYQGVSREIAILSGV